MRNKIDQYNEASKKYGEATLGELTVALTDNAMVGNYGGGIGYSAPAIDEYGNDYLVRWDITDEWERSCLAAWLRCKIEQDSHMYSPEEIEEMEAELEDLEDAGICNNEDEGNACDWDSPISIELI